MDRGDYEAAYREEEEGQGAYVLEQLRDKVRFDPDEAKLVLNLEAPKSPADVAFLSLLALGRSGNRSAYLEWALRLDPKCEFAGAYLTDYYWFQNRDADAVRVGSLMLKSLRVGKARDSIVARLQQAQARMGARPAASTNTNG